METISVWEIKSKDSKRFGRTYPGQVRKHHHAEIIPGKSIRLFGMVPAGERWVRNPNGKMVPCEEHVYRRDFKIGDLAEYGSFNMSYYGSILAISEKTVSIVESSGKVHRLDLAEFDRRNWNFNAEQSAERNARWSD